MGVEVEGSELPKVNGVAEVVVHEMENGKVIESEPITFGSHGDDKEQSVGEVKTVSNTNLPKDATDEWPAEPQVYSFWVVKYRPYEDPKLKSEIDQLDRDIQKKSAQISQLYDAINPKRAEKEELHAVMSSLGEEKSQYQGLIDQRRNEMKPLQEALGDLRGPRREKGVAICSSEQELNAIIRGLEYHIQHESVSLKEEKQILREIKEFEATRPKVIANAAMRAKVQESMGQKETIQDQVKLLGTDLDGVKKQKAAVQGKRDQLHNQMTALKDQISKLYTDVTSLKVKRQEAMDAMQELKKKREAGNTDYYQNRTIISNVKALAAKKDVKALEELVNTEVETFMSQWNSSKAFRNNYEKRILLSLDMRQLSRDGRMRNFDEKPLVKAESPIPSETVVSSKVPSKPPKEVSKITLRAEDLPAEKAQAETKKGDKESKKGDKESKAILERSMEEDVFVVEKPKKSTSNEIDAVKLKEMKKEEEKEKQRQALERRKKLQEKAAAKAALRAQKEAEKKQKGREMKLKKKDVSPTQQADDEELDEKADINEPNKTDNLEEDIETPAPPKAKESTLRHRKSVKSRGMLPKAVLKKKKSVNYWLWASAGAAAVLVLFLLVLGYNYLQENPVTA